MSGHQGPQQQAGDGGEPGQQTDADAGADADQKNQQAIDEGTAFDPVELLQINFQPHGEQQVHRPEIGEQPHRFTAAVHPVEGVWSHHDAGNQQPHQVRQTDPADEGRHRRTDRHQQRKHAEGVMHHLADGGLHGHDSRADWRPQHGQPMRLLQRLLQEAISRSPACTCQRLA